MYNAQDGMKPRKFIKRTNNSNPTFLSNHVNSLLHYDPNPQSKVTKKITPKQYQINNSRIQTQKKYNQNKKSSSTSKIQFDSLYEAKEQFQRRKLRNPDYFSNKVVRDSDQELHLASSRAKSSNARHMDDSLNFNSTVQIRLKQIHGYDIISNV